MFKFAAFIGEESSSRIFQILYVVQHRPTWDKRKVRASFDACRPVGMFISLSGDDSIYDMLSMICVLRD